jgi:RNA-binding protein YlmH
VKNRDKVIRYYKGSDNGELAARLIDLADAAAGKGRPYVVSEFVSPGEVQIAETIQAHMASLTVRAYGGYQGAERVKIAFIRDDYDGSIDYEIAACRITWDVRYRLLGHRDILGALMSLGIDRKYFGDILMQEDNAILLVDTHLVPYLKQNFDKIAMVSVRVEETLLEEIVPKEEKIKEIKTTVASMRLDAIVSSGFGISRTKAAEAINGDRIQVNWQSAKGPAQTVREGDVISLRGRGRMEVTAVTGQSRKGRTGVLLKRYM